MSGSACFHANRVKFGHFLCQAKQFRHAPEGLGGEIQIESCRNDTDALIRQFHADFRQTVVEELNLINRDDGDGPCLTFEVI